MLYSFIIHGINLFQGVLGFWGFGVLGAFKQWKLCLTCDNGRNAPANGVVEPHVALVDIAHLSQHAVNVQPLHKHPGKCTHIGVMQQDGNHCTHKLHTEQKHIQTSHTSA